MIRIVIVRVYNLGQSEIGYLDVATDEASSQQDVLLGVKSIFFLILLCALRKDCYLWAVYNRDFLLFQETFCWLEAPSVATSRSPISDCPRLWTLTTTILIMAWTWRHRVPEPIGICRPNVSWLAKPRPKSRQKSMCGHSVSFSTNASMAKR